MCHPMTSPPPLCASAGTRVTPAGITVEAHGSDLAVLQDGQVVGTVGAPAILESVEALREPRANLETAVRAALSGVQDYIADVTTEPWPGSGGRQPNPDARRLESDVVSMWFGQEGRARPPASFSPPDPPHRRRAGEGV